MPEAKGENEYDLFYLSLRGYLIVQKPSPDAEGND
jgi:hypothetical protein